MKTSLRLALGAGLLLSSLLTGCQTGAGTPSSHWNIDSVGGRVAKQFTGYGGGVDGTYLQYQRRNKDAVNLTLRRHFLNNNPENPFQAADPSLTEADGPYGILPDPLYWFGAESFFVGFMLMASTGTFIPIPLGSLLALGSEDGLSQFGSTLIGDWESDTTHPPSPSTFEVKNR